MRHLLTKDTLCVKVLLPNKKSHGQGSMSIFTIKLIRIKKVILVIVAVYDGIWRSYYYQRVLRQCICRASFGCKS